MQNITNINCQATSEKTVTIPDSEKTIVLYFYPKDSTPGCTTEGQDFRDNFQEFTQNNCLIYGVSRDNIKSHEKFKEVQKFPFELISDPEEVLCNKFGVMQLKKMYGREYMGVVRSTFVISPKGEVLKSWDKVKVKGHILEVLEFIKNEC